MNESSQSSRLPPLMSDEMAQLFVKGQLDILREELRRELEQEKIPLNQKELLKKFGFDVKYLRHLESLGLKKENKVAIGCTTLQMCMKYLNWIKCISQCINLRNDCQTFEYIISEFE